MLPVVALLAAGAAGVVGWTWWRGDGSLRPGSGERIDPADVALPDDAFGERATLLLFTSPRDDRTTPVRRTLLDLAGSPGVRLAEVDLAARGDLAGRFAVTRTPSVFALDAERRLRARVKGAGSADTLSAALARALAARG